MINDFDLLRKIGIQGLWLLNLLCKFVSGVLNLLNLKTDVYNGRYDAK